MILNPRIIIIFVLFWTIVSNALIAELSFPSTIQYLNDIAWIILSFFLIKNNFITKLKNAGLLPVLYVLLITCIFYLISILYNEVHLPLVAWAIRNSLRFYIYFIACICFLRISDIIMIFDKLFYIQLINFVLGLYQYFILGYYMDNLGGIFGHGNGAALNTFQAMIFIFYLCGYFEKKYTIVRVLIILLTSLIIAALAEEKAFFVYLIIGSIGSILLSKPSWKIILIIISLLFFIPKGILLLGSINESWNLDVLTNFDTAINYMDKSYELSRLNPYSQINELFFKDDLMKKLFGIGFGNSENCETASFLNSKFYKDYWYFQYYNFTHQKRFLESGILGFGSYVLFFITIFTILLKTLRKKTNELYIYKFCMIFCVITVLSCMFSGALIFKEAYIIYFGLSTGCVCLKYKQKLLNKKMEVNK